MAFEPGRGELASRSLASVAPTISCTNNTYSRLAPAAPLKGRENRTMHIQYVLHNIHHRRQSHVLLWYKHMAKPRTMGKGCKSDMQRTEGCRGSPVFVAVNSPSAVHIYHVPLNVEESSRPGRKDQSSATLTSSNATGSTQQHKDSVSFKPPLHAFSLYVRIGCWGFLIKIRV